MKEYVEKLVAAEMRKMPKKDYLHDRPLKDFKVKVVLFLHLKSPIQTRKLTSIMDACFLLLFAFSEPCPCRGV